jgi:hypothetical protein
MLRFHAYNILISFLDQLLMKIAGSGLTVEISHFDLTDILNLRCLFDDSNDHGSNNPKKENNAGQYEIGLRILTFRVRLWRGGNTKALLELRTRYLYQNQGYLKMGLLF